MGTADKLDAKSHPEKGPTGAESPPESHKIQVDGSGKKNEKGSASDEKGKYNEDKGKYEAEGEKKQPVEGKNPADGGPKVPFKSDAEELEKLKATLKSAGLKATETPEHASAPATTHAVKHAVARARE